MKTRAVILAGGEGSPPGYPDRQTHQAGGPICREIPHHRFHSLELCQLGIFDVMILAQYRPHSLIEHIGAGGPWDLNRDFTGGVRIYTPYKARGASDWYLGTADAVQQNFHLHQA